MNWTTVYVSSVTNAMRGKKVLEQQGYRVYLQRSSHAEEKNGCGYSLLVYGTEQAVKAALSKSGIRMIRVEHGGGRR